MPKIIKAEPGDAIISTGTGRVLINVQGTLSKMFPLSTKESNKKPSTPKRPPEGTSKGVKGIPERVNFCIHSDAIKTTYALKHELKTTIPSVTVIENESGNPEKPDELVYPAEPNTTVKRAIKVRSLNQEE